MPSRSGKKDLPLPVKGLVFLIVLSYASTMHQESTAEVMYPRLTSHFRTERDTRVEIDLPEESNENASENGENAGIEATVGPANTDSVSEMKSTSWNDIPDIPDTFARRLCRTVTQSLIERKSRFLFAVVKNPIQELKRGLPITPPRFFPGCYKWRWVQCNGEPYAPLAKHCGVFSPIRIEDVRCGRVSKVDEPPEANGGNKMNDLSCPCDWPCTPFFDPIQNCRWNKVKLDSDGNVIPETNTWNSQVFYIDHNRASQLCLAVHRTKSDQSFHLRFVPIPLAAGADDASGSCIQWMWQPCGTSAPASGSGTKCGVESCFEYTETDVETVRSQDLNKLKACGFWKKIVKSSSDCGSFKQQEIPIPPPDDEGVEALEKIMNAAKNMKVTVSVPLGHSSEIEPTEPSSTPSVDQQPSSTSDVEQPPSSTHDIEQPGRSSTELGPGTDGENLDRRKRSVARRKQIGLCRTPEYKQSPVCRFVAKGLGYDLHEARPVLNRPVPVHGPVQCYWFSESVHCTIIPPMAPVSEGTTPKATEQKRFVRYQHEFLVRNQRIRRGISTPKNISRKREVKHSQSINSILNEMIEDSNPAITLPDPAALHSSTKNSGRWGKRNSKPPRREHTKISSDQTDGRNVKLSGLRKSEEGEGEVVLDVPHTVDSQGSQTLARDVILIDFPLGGALQAGDPNPVTEKKMGAEGTNMNPPRKQYTGSGSGGAEGIELDFPLEQVESESGGPANIIELDFPKEHVVYESGGPVKVIALDFPREQVGTGSSGLSNVVTDGTGHSGSTVLLDFRDSSKGGNSPASVILDLPDALTPKPNTGPAGGGVEHKESGKEDVAEVDIDWLNAAQASTGGGTGDKELAEVDIDWPNAAEGGAGGGTSAKEVAEVDIDWPNAPEGGAGGGTSDKELAEVDIDWPNVAEGGAGGGTSAKEVAEVDIDWPNAVNSNGGEQGGSGVDSEFVEEVDDKMILKEPRQCGIFGCYPVQSVDPDTILKLEAEETEEYPRGGGYVACIYESGRPVCKFEPITTHLH